MSITIDCPRCYSSLSIPDKLAGTYTFCPRCQGRMWVPQNTPSLAAASQPATPATTTAASPVSDPAVDPMAPVKTSAPVIGTTSTVVSKSPPIPIPTVLVPGNASSPMPPPAAPPVAASPHKVAQFITADVAQSQLTLAEDGKLPELQLNPDEAGPRKRKSLSGGNSWATVAMVILSAVATVAIAVIDAGPPAASKDIKDSYDRLKGVYASAEGVDERLQTLLRQAREAHDRRDYKAEKQYYRQALGMLRDENLHPRGRNLTGQITDSSDPNLPSDKDLEEHLSKLLGQR